MPRPPRYPLIGVPQHVIQRGNNRQPTFFIEDDFRFYRECLKGRPPIIMVLMAQNLVGRHDSYLNHNSTKRRKS